MLQLLDVVDLPLLARALDHGRQINNCRNVSTRSDFDTSFKKDLRGRSSGKSTLANMMAKRMYHPHKQVTKANAPAASWHFAATAVFPFAAFRKVPARRPKAGTRVKKIKKKTKLVRSEQTR
jgi:hypothetical protein